MNAYQAGRDAYNKGSCIAACPRAYNDVQKLDWRRGYVEARQDQADMDYLNARMHLGKLEQWQ